MNPSFFGDLIFSSFFFCFFCLLFYQRFTCQIIKTLKCKKDSDKLKLENCTDTYKRRNKQCKKRFQRVRTKRSIQQNILCAKVSQAHHQLYTQRVWITIHILLQLKSKFFIFVAVHQKFQYMMKIILFFLYLFCLFFFLLLSEWQ